MILQAMLHLVLQFSAAASEPGQLRGLSALETKEVEPLPNGFVQQRWKWKAPKTLRFYGFLKLT